MEEPNPCAPTPSPYPSSRLSDTSFSLEVTPERAAGRQRKPLRRQANKTSGIPTSSTCTVIREPEDSQDQVDATNAPLPPSLLSAPGFNSTTRLYHKLNTFKPHKQPPSSSSSSSSGDDISCPITTSTSLGTADPHTRPPSTRQCVSSKQSRSSALASVADLDGVASTKPLKEVNFPRHHSRYSDLPPVDVSNESFQRLAFKPRRKEEVRGKAEHKMAAGKEAIQAPSIMDFFSSDLEWDEAAWEWDSQPPSTMSERSQLRLATVPSDSAFTLYNLMESWKH